MNIIKVTQTGGDLIFTGIDKKGNIKIGFLSRDDINKKKRIDWGFQINIS